MPGSLDRPVPDEADRRPGRLPPERLDEPRPADHGESGRWSRDDLRQRLERLPPGHPSSLRSDDPDPENRADLDDETSDRQPDAPESAYWREVPRFEEAWEDHVRRWPDEKAAAAVDRSRDPEGSWRGDGNQYLDPEQHAQAKAEIARVQRTEEALTKHMTETERETGSGWLEGLDHRRKGDERLKEKIADLLDTGAPDATPEEVVRTIPDTIRYTFCTEPSNYNSAYWDIRNHLQERGYEMRYCENHWSSTQYKGVNTRWATSEGQLFEVQFHTPESFHAKESVTHTSYERLRNALTTDGERRELMEFQREACTWITTPEGVSDIPSLREKGH